MQRAGCYMHDQGMSLMGLKIPETEKNPMTICITVKPCFTDTRLICTPHYYGQFALSLGKESPYIFSKFNPLNMNTLLIRTLSMALSVSILFKCMLAIRLNHNPDIKKTSLQ